MIRHLTTWWPYLLVTATVLAVAGFVARDHVRYWLRIARALATDKRIPAPLRWAIRVGLAVKCLPVDFGADELILGTCGLVLATVYRSTCREIIAEVPR